MASISYEADKKTAFIQWRDINKTRRGIRLAGVSKSFATRFHALVETLSDAQRTGSGLDRHTTDFVSGLTDEFYDKLSKTDLIEPRVKAMAETDESATSVRLTLGSFLADYIKRRTDVKGTTLICYEQVRRNLLKYFRADKRLAEITAGDAVDFGRFLNAEKLSRATIDRRMSRAETIFNDAVRHEYIHKNPFSGWRKPLKSFVGRTNRSRQRFISRVDIEKLVEYAPDAEWRLLLALARFGGLRTPSEPLSLKWGHVDWEHGRITVPCPKLEHIEGRETRVIPLFPELRPFLEEAFELADAGADYVISKHRPQSVRNGDGWQNANLRKMLTTIFKRAGLDVPPKAWNNMRASRATELAEQFPGHVAAQWLGHTEEIANAHYRQVLPEHFEKALTTQVVMPKVMPLDAVSNRTGSQHEHEQQPQVVTMQKETAACENMQPCPVASTGLEPVRGITPSGF